MNEDREGTHFDCGLLVLAGASVLVIGVAAVLLHVGVSAGLLEKVMTWLSVPLFTYLYFLCRRWHRTKVEWVD